MGKTIVFATAALKYCGLFYESMRKIFALIGALIAGGLSIAVTTGTQAAHAALTMN